MLAFFFKTTVVPIGTEWWFCSLGYLEIHIWMKFGLQDISLKINTCAKKRREIRSGIGIIILGFSSASAGKKSASNAGDLGSFPWLGRSPGEGKGHTPVFWPGGLHRLYSPWGHKELATTEWLSLHFTTGLQSGQIKGNLARSSGNIRIHWNGLD